MSARLILLNSAATRSSRAGAFAHLSEGLDDGGRSKAEAARSRLQTVEACLSSPSAAAIETAAALGLAPQEEAALRDIDHGEWAGQSLAEVMTHDPQGIAQWLGDPAGGAPGGETMAQVIERISPWLAEQAEAGGTAIAITHAQVMRAALAVALDMPMTTAFRIDIAPLAALTLSYNGIWRLQGLAAL